MEEHIQQRPTLIGIWQGSYLAFRVDSTPVISKGQDQSHANLGSLIEYIVKCLEILFIVYTCKRDLYWV